MYYKALIIIQLKLFKKMESYLNRPLNKVPIMSN